MNNFEYTTKRIIGKYILVVTDILSNSGLAYLNIFLTRISQIRYFHHNYFSTEILLSIFIHKS